MRSLILAACIAASPAVAADFVARQGQDVIRLTDEPCPVSVIRHIPEGHRGHFRKAHASVNGKNYLACFAARSDGMVALVYEDGDQGLIPIQLFKEDVGA